MSSQQKSTEQETGQTSESLCCVPKTEDVSSPCPCMSLLGNKGDGEGCSKMMSKCGKKMMVAALVAAIGLLAVSAVTAAITVTLMT